MDVGSDDEEGGSALGKFEHWESVYAVELKNLEELGDEGENWFGEDVFTTLVTWTDSLLRLQESAGTCTGAPELARVLDVGTGNGQLLLALAQRGYVNLTGADYSGAAVRLAAAVAARRGVAGIRWVVDDFLASRLGAAAYDLLIDKGTLDAVGLRADGASARACYRQAAHRLLAPRGLLVVTSCNSTLAELVAEFCGVDACGALARGACAGTGGTVPCARKSAGESSAKAHWEYVDHVRTYPVFRFGGVEGSRVCTAAFRRC